MIKVLFMGRKKVAADLLNKISEDHRVKIAGVITDSHLEESPTALVARRKNYPLMTLEAAISRLRDGSLEFDLGLSVLYWKKIRDEVLTTPKLGIINFHPAILPYYKGTAGYNLAILEGLEEWGVSAHYIDKNIDTGKIIEVRRFAIDSEYETANTLEEKSIKVLYDLVIDIYNNVVKSNGILPSYKNTGGKYVSRKEMEEMKKIIIGDDVNRKIRAFWFPPYDGAYIEIDGEKFTLVNRQILDSLKPEGTTSLFSPKRKK